VRRSVHSPGRDFRPSAKRLTPAQASWPLRGQAHIPNNAPFAMACRDHRTRGIDDGIQRPGLECLSPHRPSLTSLNGMKRTAVECDNLGTAVVVHSAPIGQQAIERVQVDTSLASTHDGVCGHQLSDNALAHPKRRFAVTHWVLCGGDTCHTPLPVAHYMSHQIARA